ncbi:MAG: DUF2062 domain-containing protein [Thermodesulfobacteriota bacterium]
MQQHQESKSNQLDRILSWVKKYYERFLKIRGSPHEIAMGFALGLFIGMSPFMGVHMGLAVFLAALLGYNKFAAGIAVWISNPVTAPVLYGMTYYLGARFIGLEKIHFVSNLDQHILLVILKRAPEIIGVLTVGGILLGLPVAAVGYYISLKAIQRYRGKIKRKLALEKEKRTLKKLKSKFTHKKKHRKRSAKP